MARRRDVVKAGLAGVALGLVPRVLPAARRPSGARQAAVTPGRDRLLFDRNWRFHLGHADDSAQDFGFGQGELFGKAGQFFTPSRRDFDDGAWRTLDLPHDWVVELPFENDPKLKDQGFKPIGRAYPATSIGWYRRVFQVPVSDAGRRMSLEFDGVFRDSMVAVNGHFLGRNLSGYAPFRYDITDLVRSDAPNVVVVRADATEHEGWFYEGAGIYRHVWLVKTHPVHMAPHGCCVTTALSRTTGTATISVATDIVNDADAATTCRVLQVVLDAAGKPVGMARSLSLTVQPWTGAQVKQSITAAKPALWSPEAPNMYRLVTTVLVGGGEVDRVETPFGIRTIKFDADQGFLLNGARLEIKGTCNHQDHAGVGSALPDRLQSYRIARLKAMGSNAYRTSHNPPTPELLDACDRLGMLVLDETRMFSESDEGLSQLERMIRRDRNHPSIFCWSIANEEWAVQGNDRGTRIGQALARLAHRLDPSRPVTAAMDSAYAAGQGTTLAVEVQGFNYLREDQDAFHRTFPKRPCMGTEVASTVSTRGVYANDAAAGYLSAYDVNHPSWGANAEFWWSIYATRPWLAGGFVWTGFDYRGEPTPYAWPCISSHFGILDTCGFAKDNFYYYKAWWGDEPVLHLFPHWNWAGKEGQEVEVWCHSNLDKVELFLNGQSLGAQNVARNAHVTWKVPYAPGTLEARGSKGAVALTAKRETTGAPARVVLTPDRGTIAADGEDVVVVEAKVVDAVGRFVPTAADELTFDVSGTGRLIGVGNGDPSSPEADKGTTRHLFNGLGVVIVQATRDEGAVTIKATAVGLEPASIAVACGPAAPRPAVE
jgi:beta-galactosidase